MSDDEDRVDVGARLRAERERAGMSIAKVARLTGISPDVIAWLERHPSRALENVAHLADFYGVCVGELFGAQCEPLDGAEP